MKTFKSLAQAYPAIRNENPNNPTPASRAIQSARHAVKVSDFYRDYVEEANGVYTVELPDGRTMTGRVEFDGDADWSFEGRFASKWAPGAINHERNGNGDRNSYEYFIPECNPKEVRDNARLWNASGMCKGRAWELAQSIPHHQYNSVRENEAYAYTIEIDGEFADSLCGICGEDKYAIEEMLSAMMGLYENALVDASEGAISL